jgi:hypothetical protein
MKCFLCDAKMEKRKFAQHYEAVHLETRETTVFPIETTVFPMGNSLKRANRNLREKRRVDKIRKAYKKLEAIVPFIKNETRRNPKTLEIINSAIKYITYLEGLLDCHNQPGSTQLAIENIPQFLDIVPVDFLPENEPLVDNTL